MHTWPLMSSLILALTEDTRQSPKLKLQETTIKKVKSHAKNAIPSAEPVSGKILKKKKGNPNQMLNAIR